jgi:hypothetical protein
MGDYFKRTRIYAWMRALTDLDKLADDFSEGFKVFYRYAFFIGVGVVWFAVAFVQELLRQSGHEDVISDVWYIVIGKWIIVYVVYFGLMTAVFGYFAVIITIRERLKRLLRE